MLKHVAQIVDGVLGTSVETRFLKEAAEWDKMSIEAQKQYLKEHPASKRKVTAKPSKSAEEKIEERRQELSKDPGRQALVDEILQDVREHGIPIEEESDDDEPGGSQWKPDWNTSAPEKETDETDEYQNYIQKAIDNASDWLGPPQEFEDITSKSELRELVGDKLDNWISKEGLSVSPWQPKDIADDITEKMSQQLGLSD